MLDLFSRHLFAVAIRDVSERERDGEQIGAEIPARARQRGIRVAGREQGPAEEGGDLLALAPEIEVEVLEAEQRQGIVERVVVEAPDEPEGALLGHLFLDDARAGTSRIGNEVSHAALGVADHLRRRRVGGGAALSEVLRVDHDAGHHDVPLDRGRPARRGKDLLPADLERKDGVRVPRDRPIEFGLDIGQGLALQVQLDRVAAQEGEGLGVDPDGSTVDRPVADGAAGRERDLVGAARGHAPLAPEDVLVVFRQPDVQRERRHLVRLQERQFRQGLSFPLHAVDVELVPLPVGGLSPPEEERSEDRQVESVIDLPDAESQRRLRVGDEGLDALALSGLPGALSGDDLLGRQPARGADFDAAPRLPALALRRLQDDGERALRKIERQPRAALQVEIPLDSASEVLDGSLREGTSRQRYLDGAGGVVGEQEDRRESPGVEKTRDREQGAVGTPGAGRRRIARDVA